MQKKELNIENVIFFFNNYIDKIPQNITITSSYIIPIIRKMLDYFYTDYEEIILNKEISPYSSICEVKDSCEFTEYYGIKKIEFNKLYPMIIKKLLENNEIKFNIKEVGILYLFVLDNYNNIKKNELITENSRCLCNIFINSLYMLSSNKFTNWGIDKQCLIVEYGRNILNYIINNFNDNYIYVDTDIVIVKLIDNKLLKYLDGLNLKYDVSDINFMIFSKKRYAIEEDGIFNIYGIRTNNKRIRRNTNDDILSEIEIFRKNTLYQTRIKKVRNILEKIKK